MKCLLCKHGETAPGEVTVAAQRGKCTIVIKSVPAEVCRNCGEDYLSEPTAQRIDEIADQAERSGGEVEVRKYAGAA
jgi:YgiT-type zinc finger domain-containing protein